MTAGDANRAQDGNDENQARTLNRTENRRPISPGDPDFERLFRRRNDAESINRHLDDTMRLAVPTASGAPASTSMSSASPSS